MNFKKTKTTLNITLSILLMLISFNPIYAQSNKQEDIESERCFTKQTIEIVHEHKNGNIIKIDKLRLCTIQRYDTSSYRLTEREGYRFLRIKEGSIPEKGRVKRGGGKITYIYENLPINANLNITTNKYEYDYNEEIQVTNTLTNRNSRRSIKSYVLTTRIDLRLSDPTNIKLNNKLLSANKEDEDYYTYNQQTRELKVYSNINEIKPDYNSKVTYSCINKSRNYCIIHISAFVESPYTDNLYKSISIKSKESPNKLITKKIKYIDKNDPSINIFPTESISGYEGEKYNTIPFRKEKEGYKRSLAKNSAPEQGVFSKTDNKPVIYEYEKVKGIGGLTVRYLRHDNSMPIRNDLVLTFEEGTRYNAFDYKFDIPNYKFLKVAEGSDNVEGIIEKDKRKVVTFIYTPATSVDKKIKYVFKHDPSKEVFPTESISGYEGEKYNTIPFRKEKEGYKCSLAKNSAPEKGKLSKKNNKSVIYEYEITNPFEPNNPDSIVGQVKIIREDIDNPVNFLEKPTKIKGNHDDPYNTDLYRQLTGIYKDKYDLIGIKPGYQSRGVFDKRKEKIVVYQYRVKRMKRGSVTVKYLDENNKELVQYTKKYTGFINQPYDINLVYHPKKNGYTLVFVKGKIQGRYTNKPQEVIYKFKQ